MRKHIFDLRFNTFEMRKTTRALRQLIKEVRWFHQIFWTWDFKYWISFLYSWHGKEVKRFYFLIILFFICLVAKLSEKAPDEHSVKQVSKECDSVSSVIFQRYQENAGQHQTESSFKFLKWECHLLHESTTRFCQSPTWAKNSGSVSQLMKILKMDTIIWKHLQTYQEFVWI